MTKRYQIAGLHGVTPAGFHEYVMASDYDHLARRLKALQAEYDQLTGEKFSDRVHVALRSKLAAKEAKLQRIFDYYGPPQDDCECFICEMQREK